MSYHLKIVRTEIIVMKLSTWKYSSGHSSLRTSEVSEAQTSDTLSGQVCTTGDSNSAFFSKFRNNHQTQPFLNIQFSSEMYSEFFQDIFYYILFSCDLKAIQFCFVNNGIKCNSKLVNYYGNFEKTVHEGASKCDTPKLVRYFFSIQLKKYFGF